MPGFSKAALVNCGPGYGRQCQLCDIFIVFDNIVKFLLIPTPSLNGGFPLVPLVAVLMIIIGGFMYIIAFMGGSDGSMISRAKSLFFGVAIGLVLIYGAWVIINTVLFALGARNAGFWNTICQ